MPVIVHGRSRSGGDPPECGGEESEFELRLRRTLHEIDRDVRLAEALAREAEKGEALSENLRRAVREACLIRIFRLKGFFYGPRRRGEIVAGDYFYGPRRWARERPPPGPHLEHWLEDLALYVSGGFGAGTEEIVPEEAWPLSGFVSTLAGTYEVFLGLLPEERAGWLDRPPPQ